MKRLIASTLSLIIIIAFTSCEVLKTTPRSSPDYRGPGSTYRKPAATARPEAHARTTRSRAASADSRTAKNRRTNPPARTARPGNTGNVKKPAVVSTAAKKDLNPKSSRTFSSGAPEVVQIARTFTGTPYRSGGNDKKGIDCSGLICQVYTEIGLKVPRISWQQAEFGREVERVVDLKPGDWIFFVPEGGKEGYVSHSGIVTEVRSEKDIVFIHASSSRGVIEDNLFSNYFRNRFVKAMRPF